MDRMTRGVTAGFATTLILAITVGGASLLASTQLGEQHERVVAIDAERTNLLRLQASVGALATETNRQQAAVKRLELQRLVDAVESGFVDLLVSDPQVAELEVRNLGGEPVSVGVAMTEVVTTVEFAMDFIAEVGETVSPGFVNGAVDVAVERAIAAIDVRSRTTTSSRC